MLGFGHVGKALCGILPDAFGVTAICTQKGAVVDPVLDELLAETHDAHLSQSHAFEAMDPLEAIESLDYDVLVDVIPTNFSDAQPSTTYWRTAFERKKHVVTANKGPLALHYGDMTALAEENGVQLLFEASVAGGTPVFSFARHCLRGAGILSVEGILNGTTNYMLTQMESGKTYQEALQEAQQKGYAENDPTNDVQGFDALGKAVILANALFDQDTKYADHVPQGITDITSKDIQNAVKENACFKLIARVDESTLSVKPQKIPKTHALAQIGDAWNALTFNTRLADSVTVKGKGAGGIPTASAVLNDVWELHG